MTLEFIKELLADGFFAAIAAIGFAVISNPPRRSIIFCALLAAVGHATRFLLINSLHVDIASASFLAAMLIGWLSLPFAYKVHCPTTTLYIPALLPMVPGMFAYKTIFAMMKFMQHINEDEIASLYMIDFLSLLVLQIYLLILENIVLLLLPNLLIYLILFFSLFFLFYSKNIAPFR